jgi:hypothetical protein
MVSHFYLRLLQFVHCRKQCSPVKNRSWLVSQSLLYVTIIRNARRRRRRRRDLGVKF